MGIYCDQEAENTLLLSCFIACDVAVDVVCQQQKCMAAIVSQAFLTKWNVNTL